MEIMRLPDKSQPIHKDQWEQALSELFTRFRSYGEKALRDFDAEDIHQARVNSRKLLTLLRILDRDHSSGLYPLIKQAQKRLGKVRDADVLIESFQTRRRSSEKNGEDKQAGLLKSVIRIQKKKRRSSRAKLASKLPQLISHAVSRKWDDFLGSELEPLLAKTDANQVMRELEVSYEQNKQAYRQVCRQSSPESPEAFNALHDLRISAKELRYTASAASFTLDQKFHSHEQVYKEVQEQLGVINDLRVWLDTVEAIGKDKLDVSKKTWEAFTNGLKSELREALGNSHLTGKSSRTPESF
jgi:CHAD domain-containing protein